MGKRLLIILFATIISFSCRAQDNNADKFYAEDVLEYVPYAAIFGLKACGVKSRDTFTGQLVTTGMGLAMTALTVEAMKHTIHSERPDRSDDHSFPSGHAAISFLGADILFTQYKDVSPWIGIGGYAVATTTSCLRVAHDRHHWLDVIAGAGIGVGYSRLSQWLTPKILRKKYNRKSTATISSTPCLYDNGMALAVSIKF